MSYEMIVWRGMPVPFVAIWTAEQIGPDIEWTPQGIRPTSRQWLTFQENDMWWLTVPENRTGSPVFAGTHSSRQRACMVDTLCQVCGEPAVEPVWSVPNDADHRTLWDAGRMILNPPTCTVCFELAATVCPHLLSNRKRVKVWTGTPKVVAFHGTFVRADGRTEQVWVPLDSPHRRFCLGRQLLVQLDDRRPA